MIEVIISRKNFTEGFISVFLRKRRQYFPLRYSTRNTEIQYSNYKIAISSNEPPNTFKTN